ncbi:MAG: acyltransferase family protein [Gemmatimonadaceae bacterium]
MAPVVRTTPPAAARDDGRFPRTHGLDVLRGLAALFVLLTHWSGWAGLPATGALEVFWPGGGIHPGVVLFIVLSGFCIHQRLATDPSRATAARAEGFWRAYARRRAVRIVPTYLVGLVLGMLAATLAGVALTAPGQIAGALGLAGLVQLAALLGVGAPSDLLAGNTPLVTVAVELLLYASYPLLVAVRQAHPVGGAWAVAGLAVTLYAARVALLLGGVPAERLHGSYLEFLLYWVIGGAAVEWVAVRRHAPVRALRLARCAALASAVVYVGYSHAVHVRGAHLLGTVLLAVTAALALCWVTLEEQEATKRSPSLAAAACLGERSYSLYAVHTPTVALGLAFGLGAAGSLVLTLLIAESCFRLVERPSMRLAAGSQRVHLRDRGDAVAGEPEPSESVATPHVAMFSGT